MADNDVPAMVEIPPPLSNLVPIRHPRYGVEFDKIDLKWVAVPALTRLGFDIGGVQYTAAPFVGWFMDAEIGVRDLADTFRYNALPDVASALGLLDRDGGTSEDLEDLAEYERLSILSRAQTELTYAAYWSYQQAKVSMSDTLTASIKWCRYDDDFKAKHGFRLPADPYWLAPPQGSIIPVWHRGGAPNYQPKPMISRHVQDPLKAWEREKQDWFVAWKPLKVVAKLPPRRPSLQQRSTTNDGVSSTWNKWHVQEVVESLVQRHSQRPTEALQQRASKGKTETERDVMYLSIYFCSAGSFAEKVSAKLHIRLRELARSIANLSVCSKIQPLNQLEASTINPGEVVLAIVSSTGQGEVPANGAQFIKDCDKSPGNGSAVPSTSFKYAIYGNGDSRYSATYNGAAVLVEWKFRQLGGLAFAGGIYQGDTALLSTALQALSPWWMKLQPAIRDVASGSPKLKRAYSDDDMCGNSHVLEPNNLQAEAKSHVALRSKQLLNDFHAANLVGISPSLRDDHQGTYAVTLDIRSKSYEDLSCIQVLPVNSPAKVRRALRALGVNAADRLTLDMSNTDNPTFSAFLTEYIDLEQPLQDFAWLESLPSLSSTTNFNKDLLQPLSSLESLELLHTSGILPSDINHTTAICLALPSLHPRTYSIASSLSYKTSPATTKTHHQPLSSATAYNRLDILVKSLPRGRFSNIFLSSSPFPIASPLRYRLLPSAATTLLDLPPTTPLIIIATGAGFAPVRCLLQRRIASSSSSSSSSSTASHQGQRHGSISLFLGLKPLDIPLVSSTLNAAAAAGVLGSLALVASNEGKERVYDRLREEGTAEK
ncbi:MAG: hypothetical protein L6R39_004437, partial [Caloplaca ligustica]